MAQGVRRRQDDDCAARSSHPPLRHHRRRKTISAAVPLRPRLRLLGWRCARASYTAVMISASARTRSAATIQRSRRSLTSSAISPSPKLSWARRISITRLPPPFRGAACRAQQVVIKLADRLDALLQLLIVVQPAANLINTFAPDAELLRTSPGITHRQHEHPMAFTARAFGAPCAVPHGAFQK